MLDDNLSKLGKWTGYSVHHVKKKDNLISIYLQLKDEMNFRCPECGRFARFTSDYKKRQAHDLPIFSCRVKLIFKRRRIKCSKCGFHLEYLDWLKPFRRSTKRLEFYIASLCQRMTVKDVSDITGLSWDTVKRIDKSYLKDRMGPPDMKKVRLLGMDEFAIQKGHRYATVVVDLETATVLWVGRGRSREAVRPFFEQIGPNACKKIEAAAMDQSAAYGNELKSWCPQAEIVYDLFHIVARYGREVIDRVRVDEANRLRHAKTARKVIKGSRWLLLKNPENIKREKDHIKLKELLSANRALAKVYILKAELKEIWKCKTVEAAKSQWESWYRKAVFSKIKPLVRFAKKLKEYLDGILAHSKWAIHTSVVEGINNKIKVIKRRSYGFRDDEYFFLKIRVYSDGIHLTVG